MNAITPTRPVLRWHGGKWKLAPWIIEHFPDHKVYVEPFGGGASVLMRKDRSYAEVYNDLDLEVVNLFRVLRDDGTAARLVEVLRLTPFAREEFQGSYIPTDDPIEGARRFVTRSFMGFGSNAPNVNMIVSRVISPSVGRRDQRGHGRRRRSGARQARRDPQRHRHDAALFERIRG